MKRSSFREIPSVEKVLIELGDTGLPRLAVVAVVRRELAALRRRKTIPDPAGVLALIHSALDGLRASRIRPIINGTGILVHTNFGRSPLGPVVIEALTKIGSCYSTLEYQLTGGVRGGRAAYLEHNLALLCKAEAATVVNNNAAALVLILRYFCRTEAAGDQRRLPAGARNEVVISRGELVQIGGGFRIPDILESSGARLHEIGTTNKTTLADYAAAINKNTALILKVHRSNFFMDGFVESPPTEDIAALSRKKGIPFAEDLGSGAVIKTERVADLEHEPTPAEVLRRRVDLVCFSGDKMLGGPQAGVIVGKAKLIAALKQEAFFRAVRCDKLVLAALEATVDIYLDGRSMAASRKKRALEGESSPSAVPPFAGVPLLTMLHLSNEELRARGEKMIAALNDLPLQVNVGTGRAQIGGGALPRSVIPSVTLDLLHSTLPPKEFSARLRANALPLVGYIKDGKVKLDLRTIFPWQDVEVVRAIRSVL